MGETGGNAQSFSWTREKLYHVLKNTLPGQVCLGTQKFLKSEGLRDFVRATETRVQCVQCAGLGGLQRAAGSNAQRLGTQVRGLFDLQARRMSVSK